MPDPKIPELVDLPPVLAVQLAGATSNPTGLPDNWPVRMEDRRRMETLPDGWLEMTAAEYRSHLLAFAAEFGAWDDAQTGGRTLEPEGSAS